MSQPSTTTPALDYQTKLNELIEQSKKLITPGAIQAETGTKAPDSIKGADFGSIEAAQHLQENRFAGLKKSMDELVSIQRDAESSLASINDKLSNQAGLVGV